MTRFITMSVEELELVLLHDGIELEDARIHRAARSRGEGRFGCASVTAAA